MIWRFYASEMANLCSFRHIRPQARYYLTHTDIQRDALLRLLSRPWLLLQGRAKIISESLQHCWQMTGLLKDIAAEPRWIINATAYESGKNWRFMPQRMGDYLLNYVLDPAIPLADAVAASAAYPGLIGPLILRTSDFKWSRFAEGSKEHIESVEPAVKYIHLWDGGVYDNLGVEALFKPRGKKFRDGYNFLIVSDASQGMKIEKSSFVHRRALRLVNIATDQVRSLRARNLVNHFNEQPNSGVYLRIGNTARYILEQADMHEEEISTLAKNCMLESDVNNAANLATTLRKLSEEEFDRVYRHGWEVANCTLLSRCPSLFEPV